MTEQMVLGMMGLNPHLSRQCAGAIGVSACATSGLHEQGKQSFRGSEVAAEQPTIGVECSHQTNAAKVVTFGHHLGSDQHIGMALMKSIELAGELTFEAHRVCVHSHERHWLAIGFAPFAHPVDQFFLDVFGALSQAQNLMAAA